MARRGMSAKEFEIVKLMSTMTHTVKGRSYEIAYDVLRNGKSMELVASERQCTPQNVNQIVKRFRKHLKVYYAARDIDKTFKIKT